MKKIIPGKKTTYFIWAAFIVAFLLFIRILSYLYPKTGDDYTNASSWVGVIKGFIFSYNEYSPKIGSLIAGSVLYIGRSFFLFFNPLVQLIDAMLLFLLIFLKIPDLKKFEDFTPFALICLLGVFSVAAPDNTIFWMAGACNYSWTMIFFLLFLCLLRFLVEDKNLLSENKFISIAVFVFGIIVGMSNENNGPMALLICGFAFATQKYKKAKVPSWFFPLFAGALCGVILLLSAKGSYNRLSDPFYLYFQRATLPQRIYMNFSYIQDFIAGNFYFPMITFTALAIALFDDKRNLKDKDFIFSAIFLFISFGLATALLLAPQPPQRSFYSASILSNAAFVLCLKYWGKLYSKNLLKLFFIAIVIYTTIIMPLFFIPYLNLHEQALKRETALNKARAENKAEISLPKYIVLQGPSRNLTITFYDVLLGRNNSIKQFLHISYQETAQEATENISNISSVI